MDFKKMSLKQIFIPLSLAVLVMGVILWKFFYTTDPLTWESVGTVPSPPDESGKEALVKPVLQDQATQAELTDDATIQKQLDEDRQEQKQTKYLKTKLEQTNLELEQEKAFAEISKLKMENRGAFKDPVMDGQNDLPEIKIEYIGGDSVKKEAILSIAGANYQVKEKSHPMDNIQILSISDSSVTLHINGPINLTKTIEYKPE